MMPRYVLLAHDHPFPHWDLMLDAGGILRTWRLNAIPEIGHPAAAEPIGDHRMAFLDYEGPVSGDRGVVKMEDAGTFEWRNDRPDMVQVSIDGKKLQGMLEISPKSDHWICRLTR
jgi:hypothetical protein